MLEAVSIDASRERVQAGQDLVLVESYVRTLSGSEAQSTALAGRRYTRLETHRLRNAEPDSAQSALPNETGGRG